MISSIEGKLVYKSSEQVIILLGGLGVEVHAPFPTIEKLGSDRVFLHTRLIPREDSLTLYGFTTIAERDLFDTLLKISGVGPKLALKVLSTLTVDNIRSAVLQDKPELLVRVPGIGKKTAQKMLLELQDTFPTGLESLPNASMQDSDADVLDALTALGYSVVEAQAAIQALPPDAPAELEQRVFVALQSLGR